MQAKDAVWNLVSRFERPFLLAIDGRCAAGKSTLAVRLATKWDCNVLHMDDFYLPFSRRTPERMAQPGGHMDLERLREEVLLPLRAGQIVRYRPYACHDDRWLPEREADGRKPTVVEGAYSCHPALSDLFDARVFLEIGSGQQLERLRIRDPGAVDGFLTTWIPREEQYFSACAVRSQCDLVLNAEEFIISGRGQSSNRP